MTNWVAGVLGLVCLTVLCSSCDVEKPPVTVTPPPRIFPAQLVSSPELSGENALFHVVRIVEMGDRSPATYGALRQRAYISKYLRDMGWRIKEQTSRQNVGGKEITFTNVRARYGASVNFNQSSKGIVSCHIDTKTGVPNFVGANDGASGVAVMLELARVLTAEHKAEDIEFVFFDGEESMAGGEMMAGDGLYGSRYYASVLPRPLPQWLINLDMVGRKNMKIRVPPDTDPELYKLYKEAITELPSPGETWGVQSFGVIDDHVPFVQLGIPCINLIDDFSEGRWWHTERDNLDIISEESLHLSGNMVLRLLDKIRASAQP